MITTLELNKPRDYAKYDTLRNKINQIIEKVNSIDKAQNTMLALMVEEHD